MNYKIRVTDPEHSKKIQDWAFSKGCNWLSDSSEKYLHTGAKFLFIYGSMGRLSFEEHDEDHFLGHSNKEVTLEELTGKPKLRPVKVGDIRKCYFNDGDYWYIYSVISIFEENGNTFCKVQIVDSNYEREDKGTSVHLLEAVEKDRRIG